MTELLVQIVVAKWVLSVLCYMDLLYFYPIFSERNNILIFILAITLKKTGKDDDLGLMSYEVTICFNWFTWLDLLSTWWDTTCQQCLCSQTRKSFCLVVSSLCTNRASCLAKAIVPAVPAVAMDASFFLEWRRKQIYYGMTELAFFYLHPM